MNRQPRIRIVRVDGGYRGMDRPALGSFPDVPEPLVLRGIALEDAPDERALRALMSELRALGKTDYDILALGDRPGEAWELLGHDVGETTPTAWSAISHRETFLDPSESHEWNVRLNDHGLFSRKADAAAFLDRYLAANDPDGGWTAAGWTDAPMFYAVVPVYRLVWDDGDG